MNQYQFYKFVQKYWYSKILLFCLQSLLHLLKYYVDVDSIYFFGCSASKSNYPFKIYVNDVEVISGAITGSTPTCYGGTITKASGKVKISVSGINAALVFAGIGINSLID